MVRVRRTVILLVLLASAVLPGSAFADVPVNDTQAGAVPLPPTFSPAALPLSIPPVGPAPVGGWTDATTSEDGSLTPPGCLNFNPYHSMWYSVEVREAGVLTVTLTSTDVTRYQPVVSITGSHGETACGLGGSDRQTDPTASASSFVSPDTYFVRIGSVGPGGTGSEGPTLRLTETIQDVTPPEVRVSVSGAAIIVGPGKEYTFDASASKDAGSDIDPTSAKWEFFEDGKATEVLGKNTPDPLTVTHKWATAGVHQVTLQLADKSKNVNTYTFTVLVHNFVPPRVSFLVRVPSPGARRMRVVLTHDMPINVRLVVIQDGRVLRAVTRTIKGSHKKTILNVALRKRVGKIGYVVVSGVASDLGDHPNTVPLLTCSVDPVNGGGTCA
jgi:hypothetical protein